MKGFIHKKLFFIVSILVVVAVSICVILKKDDSSKLEKELYNAIDEAWTLAQSEEQPAYLTKLDQMATYELNSIELEEDGYMIEMQITAPDLGGWLADIDDTKLPQTSDMNEINSFLCDGIEKSEMITTVTYIYAYERTSNEVDCIHEKADCESSLSMDNRYEISFSKEFIDAMSGNVYSYSQAKIADILQNYAKEEVQ